MAWTVTASKSANATSKTLTLTYTDGTRTIVEAFEIQGIMTNTVVANRAQAKIDWLNAQDASATAITEGTVTPAPPVVVTPPAPTQAEIDLQLFLADYAQWKKVKQLIDLGVIDVANTQAVALLNKVKAEWKNSYITVI